VPEFAKYRERERSNPIGREQYAQGRQAVEAMLLLAIGRPGCKLEWTMNRIRAIEA
jgi:hypothetical protein